MNINKPKFWDKKLSLFSILLIPFSLIFLLVVLIKKKLIKSNSIRVPVICVGNIYLGGTGKTPLSIFLALEFSKLGKKTSIVRKYYKNHSDEFNMIKNTFDNLIVNKTRLDGLKEAEKNGSKIVILDDGFQDYKIKKDLNIICFNSNQLVGNGLVLPAGPLRESLSALRDANIVMINGDKNEIFEKKILNINKKLEIFYSSYEPINLEKFKGKKLLAIAGIGNPENFFKLIEDNNLKIEDKLIFPDHHRFTEDEIKKIVNKAQSKDYQIIMTEKDYYKIDKYKLEKIDYLKVSLKIDKKEKFLDRIGLINV